MENFETLKKHSQKHFRLYLERELQRRVKSNSGYSLRSFARDLDTDPSLLSKLIRGKRKISNKQIDRLGKLLNLSLRSIESFKTDSYLDYTQEEPYQLSLDQFDIIADWQHYAILEMMSLKSFKPDIKWIAKKLNLSTQEVGTCLQRLQRVGILKIHPNGKWEDLSHGKSTHILDKNFTSYAHKKAQKNILEKAIHSIDHVAIEERDQSSIMMSCSKEKIDEAKHRITQFRRELSAFLEDTEEKDSVYQISISLFPLITTNKGEDE
ncbi:MAG: TIGR02147 family protein [Bdellovibrionota bacterium]